MARVVLRKGASRQLKKLPPSEVKKNSRKLIDIANEPFSGKLLKGEYAGLYSFRAWPYRIIYRIVDQQIEVCAVEHRQGVYK